MPIRAILAMVAGFVRKQKQLATQRCHSNQEKYDDCRRLARRVSQNFSRLYLNY
jgi:hypothetical protein